MNSKEKEWDLVVKPKVNNFQLNLKEVWAYKDLILLLVKRDITSVYKQTILGPLWMIIQPVFTTAIYTFTFSTSAKLSTDGLPPVLFYLLGQTFWNYFSDCLNKTSNTFIANASVFGKVYFPRLVVPISVVLSNLIKLGLQFGLFLMVYFYYYFRSGELHVQMPLLFLLPLAIILLGLFSLSIGIIFSSFTTKYRDLIFLLSFAVQLLMFASCVVFPVSMYSVKAQSILMLNPIVTIMETIKYVLTGAGTFSPYYLMLNSFTILVVFVFAIVMFNRTEKSFMDTV
jgi:lipopolysaccharide transport system permease protein